MGSWPKDIRAKFEHVVRSVQANGLERVHEPCLEEKLRDTVSSFGFEPFTAEGKTKKKSD